MKHKRLGHQDEHKRICCSVKTFLYSTGILFVLSFGAVVTSITAYFLTSQPIFFAPREIFTISLILSSYYLLTSFSGFYGFNARNELCLTIMLCHSFVGFLGQIIGHILFFILASGNGEFLENLGFGGFRRITLNNEQRLTEFSQFIGTEELWEAAQNDGNCCGVSIEAIAISVLLDGIDAIPQTHSGILCSANQTLEDELNTLLQNINQENLQDTITQGEENENFGIDTGFFCLDAAQILSKSFAPIFIIVSAFLLTLELTAIISGIRLYYVPKEKGGFFVSPKVYLKNNQDNSEAPFLSGNVFSRASARVAYTVNQQFTKQLLPTYPVNNADMSGREADGTSYQSAAALDKSENFKQFGRSVPPELPARTAAQNDSEDMHNLATVSLLRNPRYDNGDRIDEVLAPSKRKKSKRRRRNRRKNFKVNDALHPSKGYSQSQRSFEQGLTIEREESKKRNKLSVQFKNKVPSVRNFYDRLRFQSTAVDSSIASPSFLAFTRNVNSRNRNSWDEENENNQYNY
eukprot:snap_masked-scaffold_1-processed-gene-12.30-mRNA-1 protein AED:1.00 eAED:1.00 QI:0/-1/0/0/-1/1/1/0/519